MRLKQTNNIRTGGTIEPFDEYDRPLFQHCANGMCAVTEDYFNDVLLQVLQAHGVSGIEINGCEL